jgi:outer membrane protein OmpA-like peptidoglycan-associated protein
MKKIGILCAAALMAASVSAQTVTGSKTFDNIYVGINGGVATKATGNSWLGNLDPNAGLRIGRYFTPVFGLAVEGNAYFSNKPYPSTGTFVRGTNVSLLGTVNLSNWFGGYKGQPRFFEVVALGGLGWGHIYGDRTYIKTPNNITSKVALDFTWNLGSNKAWQVYLEPAMVWGLNDHTLADNTLNFGKGDIRYDLNNAMAQINVGIVYKFKNSNGTHNFTIAQLRDQSEVDGLNSQINSLRSDLNNKDSQLAAKDKQIQDLQGQLDDCNKKPAVSATATNLQPTVLFRVGRSTIDPAQYAPIELIASYMKNHPDAKVAIKGYASPEGPAKVNQKLSEDRANAVMKALIKKYKIAADRLTAKGCGVTDKLFEQVEFNRVATFDDTTK